MSLAASETEIYLINQDYFYYCPQCFDSILICFVQGYVGSKSFLEEVLQVVHDLRQANPNLVFGMYLSCEFSSWGTVVCSNIQYWIGVGLIIKFWNYFLFTFKVCDPVMGDAGKFVSITLWQGWQTEKEFALNFTFRFFTTLQIEES